MTPNADAVQHLIDTIDRLTQENDNLRKRVFTLECELNYRRLLLSFPKETDIETIPEHLRWKEPAD